MAQMVVDSAVMREKANLLDKASGDIRTLYTEMLQNVNSTASQMKGTTVTTQKERFASMQATFETIATDIKAYGTFLNNAANDYDRAETEGTQKAQQQGKVF